jgi:multiple sugar transport system permease protein
MQGEATSGKVVGQGAAAAGAVPAPTAQQIEASREAGARRGPGRTLTAVLKHGALWLVGAVFILPMFWMLTTSLKTPEQVVRVPIQWIPDPLFWANYPNAFFRDPNQPLLVYIWNTVWVAFWSVLGALISNTLVAYGFARLRWPGRDVLFMFVIATLLLPFAVTMIPLYLLWNALGQTNTYWPLIVPAWLASPFSVFLLRQFFMGIPQELSESARIDGASELQILWRIIVPLARPGLAVVALFQFMGVWNDFTGPLIFLRDKLLFTISLGLRNMQNAYGLSNFGEIMAASTITVLPVVIIFFLTQRTFIQGITFSGIKG